MKWGRDGPTPGVTHAVIECLTAIQSHTSALRRRLRRGDPVARAEALDHLAAIERHVEEAAARLEALATRNGR